MLEQTAPGLAQHAERMRLVDHQPGAVSPLDLDQPLKVRAIAIHGEQPLGHDQAMAELATLRTEDLLQRIEIIVREIAPVRARQLGADNDAVVRQRVMNDEVFRPDDGADHRHVGRMPADEQQRCLCAIERRQLSLEHAMEGPLARGQTAGGHTGPPLPRRVGDSRNDLRMAVQAEIVIG